MFYGYYNEYSILACSWRKKCLWTAKSQSWRNPDQEHAAPPALLPPEPCGSKLHRPPRVSDCNFPSSELSWFLMRPSNYELIMATTASAWWLHSLAFLSIVDTSCQKYLYLAESHHAVTPRIATTTWRAQSEPELMLWLFVFMNKRNFVDLFNWLIMQTIR